MKTHTRLISINEEEIFKVNSDLQITEKKIGDYKAIIIDNFYTNPDKVRDLALMTPSSVQTFYKFGTVGHKIHAGYDLSPLAKAFHKICINTFSFAKGYGLESFKRSFKEMHFTCNLSTIEDYDSGIGGMCPHVDGYRAKDNVNRFKHGNAGIGSIITLNTDDECKGGTSFWKYKGEQSPTPHTLGSMNNNVPFMTETSGDWELIDIVPIKYNRLTLYPIDILHSPYIKQEHGFNREGNIRMIQTLMP